MKKHLGLLGFIFIGTLAMGGGDDDNKTPPPAPPPLHRNLTDPYQGGPGTPPGFTRGLLPSAAQQQNQNTPPSSSRVLPPSGYHATPPSQNRSSKTYHTRKAIRKHAKGFKRDRESRNHMRAIPKVSFTFHEQALIPKSVDLSTIVSPPEDQGNCGACWAFSLTKALRSEYMLQGKDPGTLEFNYLLGNCGPGPKMGGCDGGDFPAASSFLDFNGPGLNKLNPFKGVPRRCRELPVMGTAVSYAMLGEGKNGPTFKDLAYAMGVGRHVLAVDVAADSGDWEDYSGGIYNLCAGGPQDIDHMVNLVGYDCETSLDAAGACAFDDEGKPINGDGYLLVMNNWGESWGTEAAVGHKGYMKTRMYGLNGQNCNAIAVDALMFLVDASKPIEPPPLPVIPMPSPVVLVPPVAPQPLPDPLPTMKPEEEEQSSCNKFLCGFFGCKLFWCKK